MNHRLDDVYGKIKMTAKRISINALDWESFNRKVFLYLVSLKQITKLMIFFVAWTCWASITKKERAKQKHTLWCVNVNVGSSPTPNLLLSVSGALDGLEPTLLALPSDRTSILGYTQTFRLKENVHSCLWSCSTGTSSGFACWSWTCLPCLGVSWLRE